MTSLVDRWNAWNAVLEEMPESVRAVVPGVLWRRELLWGLSLPVEDVPIAELAWLLDLPVWSVGERPFRVTPNEVRDAPSHFPEQYQRTMACNLSYPIHLLWHNGRWTILDGIHRLLKAQVLGWTHVLAMKLSASDFRQVVEPVPNP